MHMKIAKGWKDKGALWNVNDFILTIHCHELLGLCRKYPSGVVTVLPLYAGDASVTTSYNRQALLQHLGGVTTPLQ
jgi:hypothetical protein